MVNYNDDIKSLLEHYCQEFSDKEYGEENNDEDILMKTFNITPELKRENRQYWGRELGMFWQRFITLIFKNECSDIFKEAPKYGNDEPVDLIVGKYAIDTKYRVGSGDSGTLKKFKNYGKLMKEKGYIPVFLIVREDNLPAAITAIQQGGWRIYTGSSSFEFVKNLSGVDIEQSLELLKDTYFINRNKNR
ncbi:hypothetical protein LDK25_04410 [Fusobacterium nucleatum]|uniref:hypothetical protein n=1 Tax=Fusobacterium nucleatum TaxID=851 RepID=UPI0030EBF4CE